jgi:hypothetical protein
MDNYEDAAVRHYDDAEALRKRGRLDKAGHLIGFAAECAIKYRIETLRPGENSPHGHFPDILVAARKQLCRRGDYVSMYQILKGDIFRRWHVNRRYHSTGGTSDDEIDHWFRTTRRLFATAEIKRRQ